MIELVSLFSGAGGLDYGFEQTGCFSIRARVEIEPQYCETLETAQTAGFLQSAPICRSDFRELDPGSFWDDEAHNLRGVIAGPPCESFSSFGLRLGRSDPRGQLLFDLVDWVARAGADFFLIENVPFLIQGRNHASFAALVRAFEKHGFSVSFKVLTASDFGAATYRKRLITLGRIGDEPLEFPVQTHFDPTSKDTPIQGTPWVTVETALAGLPQPATGLPGDPSGHVRIRHTDDVARRFAVLAPGAYDDVRRRFRLSEARPSPSLVAGNLSGTRSHIHPTEARELTNRECARIQGFPDAYAFSGSRAAVAKQIANAVPVPLARSLAIAIAEQLAAHVRS